MSNYARVELAEPPHVAVPSRYNAAVDFVERHLAEGRGDRVAFVEDGLTTTYRALADRAARVANAIRGLGVVPEQRVLLCLHDTADFAAIFFGAIRAGAVPVPVSTSLTSDEYAFILADSRARIVFVSDVLLEKVSAAATQASRMPRVVVVRSPLGGSRAQGHPGLLDKLASTQVSRTVAHLELDSMIEVSDPMRNAEATAADDVAFWLYTPSRGGPPNGVMHLHSHLVQTAALFGFGVLGIREDDRVLSTAKLFSAYGFGNALTFPLYFGASAVLMAHPPTPVSVMRALEAHEATVLCSVPALLSAILTEPGAAGGDGSPYLRLALSSGDPLPKATGEAWRARFGVDVLDALGSTEMLHVFLSGGKPVPGYQVKLEGERGGPVPTGEVGTLWVSGPSSGVGYWCRREQSLATFHGPWTRTGERCVRLPEGSYARVARVEGEPPWA